jgi:hypothetical protein
MGAVFSIIKPAALEWLSFSILLHVLERYRAGFIYRALGSSTPALENMKKRRNSDECHAKSKRPVSLILFLFIPGNQHHLIAISKSTSPTKHGNGVCGS